MKRYLKTCRVLLPVTGTAVRRGFFVPIRIMDCFCMFFRKHRYDRFVAGKTRLFFGFFVHDLNYHLIKYGLNPFSLSHPFKPDTFPAVPPLTFLPGTEIQNHRFSRILLTFLKAVPKITPKAVHDTYFDTDKRTNMVAGCESEITGFTQTIYVKVTGRIYSPENFHQLMFSPEESAFYVCPPH
jgi:hypothetical protein